MLVAARRVARTQEERDAADLACEPRACNEFPRIVDSISCSPDMAGIRRCRNDTQLSFLRIQDIRITTTFRRPRDMRSARLAKRVAAEAKRALRWLHSEQRDEAPC